MLNKEQAETIALQAVAFLVKEDDLVDGMCALTGIDPASLSDRLGDKDVLAACLNHLLNHEQDLLRFCDIYGLAPELPAQACYILENFA